MDIHKPKPWHGVREFLKEIGTIVIGVLIAIAAEQTAEAFRLRVEDVQISRQVLLANAEHSVACAQAENRSPGNAPSLTGGFFALAIGVMCLVVGAHFTVGGAMNLAAAWHIPPATVAMTVVALGAVLPVLAITLIAALRGFTQIAIGHLITASVFNVFGILGIAALVRPLTVSPAFATADIFAVLGAVVLLLPLLSANWSLSRLKGAFLMLVYIGYLGFTAWRLGFFPHGIAL